MTGRTSHLRGLAGRLSAKLLVATLAILAIPSPIVGAPLQEASKTTKPQTPPVAEKKSGKPSDASPSATKKPAAPAKKSTREPDGSEVPSESKAPASDASPPASQDEPGKSEKTDKSPTSSAPQKDEAGKSDARKKQEASKSGPAPTPKAAPEGTMEKAKRVAIFVVLLLVTLVLPFWFGGWLARRMRAKEFGWRIGVTLASIACAVMILVRAWDPEEKRLNLPLGVDLKGGVILVYEVLGSTDETADGDSGASDQKKTSNDTDAAQDTGSDRIEMGALCQAIKKRIDPAGTLEIVVRPYGSDHVEVIIPKVDPIEVNHIKRMINTAGVLEFRIVANSTDHQSVMRAARMQASSSNRAERTRRKVFAPDGTEVAFWADLGREERTVNGVKPFKVDVYPGRELLRVSKRSADCQFQVGDILEIPGADFRDMAQFAQYLEQIGVRDIQVLMYRDEYNVTGKHLGIIKPDFDEQGKLCVSFTLRGEGPRLFGMLTGQNIPDPNTGTQRRLGILLDGTLLSAPVIQSRISYRGQITGRFTQQEIDFLVGVLRSGRLPAVLSQTPISENNIGSELGEETIRKGKVSMVVAMASVLAFILIYYGRFAGPVACLALLLNLLFILALMVQLSAPLTLPGLAGLVLTVGMSVDANVLIYERIREELRRGAALRMAIRNGFSRATTTIVDANLTTLITAIVLYVIGSDQVRGFAVTLIFGILMSMYTAIFISRIIFELSERQRRLKQLKMLQLLSRTNIDFINKRAIAAVFSTALVLIGLGATFSRGKGLFDIDFNGGTQVAFVLRQPMEPDEVRDKLRGEFEKGDAKKEAVQFTVNEMTQEGHPPRTLYRVTSSLTSERELIDRIVKALRHKDGTSALQSYEMTLGEVRQAEDGGSQAILEFQQPIRAEVLLELIRDAAQALKLDIADPMLGGFADDGTVVDVEPGDQRPYTKWEVGFAAEPEQAQRILEKLRTTINERPVILQVSVIGGKVAEDAKNDAMWAMIVSLLGIIAYIWIRFQRVQYGLAAVVALVHDVLITLGAIAVSKWLAPFLGVLLIEEFKISLPVVAAFLTIIGYSLNDTIVVFDRIREVRGKSPQLTAAMINTSINQTLSRTLLTSLTTFIVVAILYFFGGEGIHAFAFSLVVGVIVGTYSSIFVASPALLWMLQRTATGQAATGGTRSNTAAAL